MSTAIRVKLTLDVFTPQPDYKSLEIFIRIAISSCCGIPFDDLRIDSVEGTIQGKKTTIFFRLFYESLVDSWGMVARIRSEVSLSHSSMHTLPKTRKVFSGSIVEIADPRDPLDGPFQPRYISKSPLDLQYAARLPTRGRPPEAPIRLEKSMIEKNNQLTHLSLPDNSTHDPISVVFVDACSGERVQDADRSVTIQVAQEVSSLLLDEEEDFDQYFIDLKKITEFLTLPPPSIPASLRQLREQLTHMS